MTGRGTLRRSVFLLTLLLLAVLATACSDSDSTSSSEPDTSPETSITDTTDVEATVPDDSVTTLPPGAVAGLDDYDGDGQLDPTCGTQDFGAGLVLRIPCSINTANELEQGTRLVGGSLFRLPGAIDINLDGISGSLVLARDTAGAKVVIVVSNSDNLFETGSAVLSDDHTLDPLILRLNSLYPGGRIEVRGHTDSTGSADANQTLSEERADAVREYLVGHGIDAAGVTSVGLASTQPLTEEREPDGSDSAAGMRFNRRVEIVIRPVA